MSLLLRFAVRLLSRKILLILALFSTLGLTTIATFVFIAGFQSALHSYKQLGQRFVVNIFLPTNADSATILTVHHYLRHIRGLDTVEYISPKHALDTFTQIYGPLTQSLFPTNPFPPTFLIYPSREYFSTDSIHRLVQMITHRFPFLDISYRQDYLEALAQKHRQTTLIASIGSILLGLLFLLLLFAITRWFFAQPSNAIRALQYHGIPSRTILRPYGLLYSAVLVLSLTTTTVAILITLNFLPNILPFNLPPDQRIVTLIVTLMVMLAFSLAAALRAQQTAAKS